MPKLLEVKGLNASYGATQVLFGIDFSLEQGKITAILGANGAGKTTAIRMLCGLLPPTSGEATVAGFSIRTHAAEIKRRIGYMSQRFSLYEDLTVEQNIEFYGGVYGLDRVSIRRKTDELLVSLDLTDMRRSLTGSLPLGWKQRLALGTALLHDPAIIFLDEPTGGVDPISRRRFWRIIYDVAARGTTVFVTTHYMDEAEYCTRVSIMHQGRIIEMGGPHSLKQKHGLASMQDIFIALIGG